MHHKRKRPKHQRSGACILCAPHKDERRKKTARSKRARAELAEPIVSFERFCADMGIK